jgi:hypothetical protein
MQSIKSVRERGKSEIWQAKSGMRRLSRRRMSVDLVAKWPSVEDFSSVWKIFLAWKIVPEREELASSMVSHEQEIGLKTALKTQIISLDHPLFAKRRYHDHTHISRSLDLA